MVLTRHLILCFRTDLLGKLFSENIKNNILKFMTRYRIVFSLENRILNIYKINDINNSKVYRDLVPWRLCVRYNRARGIGHYQVEL